MAKVLSQEEIDALLTSVSAGEKSSSEVDSKYDKVSLYDFKHPNLISKEQLRILENIHEGFVRNLGVFLSAQLRMIVDMKLLAVDQIMYSEFVMSIASPAATYVGNIKSPHSQFVMEISPQLVVFIVERLFGGQGSFKPITRPISVIERKIMNRVIERISQEISKNWSTISNVECEFTRFESNPEFVQIVPASEPVVVVSMEIKVRGNATMLNLCYPYMWVSNILSSPDVQKTIMFGSMEASEKEREIIESSLNLTKADLVAILGKSIISIRDIIELKKGDVILLNPKINSSIPILIQNHYKFDGIIGNRNSHYAVRIQSVNEGETIDEY
ncbi:MAG: flagellar motor switch protein FliM [Candidatus Neomarinimicrobiota bacterium]|nr:MAG: flagellar motor switch protein FliM [Candidatus Neomarinimicrobiota bacterium]